MAMVIDDQEVNKAYLAYREAPSDERWRLYQAVGRAAYRRVVGGYECLALETKNETGETD